MPTAPRSSGLALFSCLILVAMTTNASELHDDAAETIRSLTDQWLEVSAAGDIDGYFSLVTDDFIWLGSDTGQRYEGQEAVRAFLEPFFETLDFSMENVKSEEVVTSADGQFAVHQWFGTAVVASKDGSSISKYPRKYFDFWRREKDGSWRCSVHQFVVID